MNVDCCIREDTTCLMYLHYNICFIQKICSFICNCIFKELELNYVVSLYKFCAFNNKELLNVVLLVERLHIYYMSCMFILSLLYFMRCEITPMVSLRFILSKFWNMKIFQILKYKFDFGFQILKLVYTLYVYSNNKGLF